VLAGDIGRLHTLQLDSRHAAIDADMGVAIMGDDVVMRREIGERFALDMDKGLTLDEVLDEVLFAELVGEGSEEVALHASLPGRMGQAADQALVA